MNETWYYTVDRFSLAIYPDGSVEVNGRRLRWWEWRKRRHYQSGMRIALGANLCDLVMRLTPKVGA